MKWYSARAPSRVTCHGTRAPRQRLVDAGLPAFRERDHPLEGVVGQDLAERRAGGRQRQGVAGQRPADAADIRVRHVRARQPGGDLRAEPVGRRRDPATDRLADDDDVRVEAPGAGRAARPGADGVGLVDDEERARPPGDLADRVVVAGLGQDDPDVGQRRLEQDRRDVAVGEGRLEPGDVVELDDPGRLGDVDLRPDRSGDRHDRAVGAELGDRLVDRPVVAVVVDDDLGAAGHVAGQPEHPAVGVAGRQGELPRPDPEPPGQLLADPGGVLGRQHVGDPAAHLAFDRGHRRGGPVAGHRPGVAEAEVDVVVAVDAA